MSSEHGRRLETSWGVVGCSGRIPEYREAIRARMLRDSAHGGWERSIIAVPVTAPSGTAHHTDSCVVVFIEIADLGGQLEIITDGRLPHVPSLVRAAAGDERCAQSIPRSANEGQGRSSFPVAKTCSAKRTAKRSAPSGIAAPPKRQNQAELQTTMLAHMEGFAGTLEVSAPIAAPCSSGGLALLRVTAASRKSASPTLHDARTLLGAFASVSRSRLPVKPVCAVP